MDTVVELLATLADNGVRLSVDGDQLTCYAPKGSLTQVQKNAIQFHKSDLVSLLKKKQQDINSDASSDPEALCGKDFPMTVGAQALYIIQELEPDSSAFNVPLCLKIIGAIDVPLLERAWNSVLDQHPVLMTRVDESRGLPVLQVDRTCRARLRCIPLDMVDDAKALSLVRSRACLPFDLRQGPLVRIELFQHDESRAILLVTAHHIIFDGTSGVLLLKALLANYRRMLAGSFVKASTVSFGYADYSVREREMLASPDGVRHSKYWQNRLAGIPPKFQLVPGVRPDAASHRDEGSTFTEELGDELSGSLRAIAAASGMTASSVLLAVFVLLLRRYSGESDIVVGMPVSLRSPKMHATDLGYFINMVPLRIECKDDCIFQQYLRNVQYTMIDALYHSNYPVDGVVDIKWGSKSKSARGTRHSQNALYQVSYAYQDFLNPEEFSRPVGEPGPETEYVSSIAQEGDSDLNLQVFNNGSRVILQLSYDSNEYARGTVLRFFAHYRQLLQAVVENPNVSNREFDYLNSEEKKRVLVDFNRTRMDHPSNTAQDCPQHQCVHLLFEAQVARTPEATALVCGTQRVSYTELNKRANRLAHYLIALHVKPDDRVAICAERGVDMVVAMFATLKSGGAYVPLDSTYPAERIVHMLGDSAPVVVLTCGAGAALAATCVDSGTAVLDLLDDAVKWCDLSDENPSADRIGLTPRNLAYVIYTSGSTGTPKGVMIEHRGLVNYTIDAIRWFELTPNDVVLQQNSLNFDLSIEEMLPPLLCGACLLPSTQLFGFDMTDYSGQLTMVHLTAAHWHILVGEWSQSAALMNAQLAGVRLLNVTGDALSMQKLVEWESIKPDWIRLINTYGPTEATISCTAEYVRYSAGASRVTIGKPFANTSIYIVDETLKPVPIGVSGELYIGGVQVARGYLNRPELTAERFIDSPFHARDRLYKTGDLARWMEDGTIDFLGRNDFQVKVRGFRIEVGEVESALCACDGVREAIVLAREDAPGEKSLVAYYMSDLELASNWLRENISKKLPEYMLPRAFVRIDAWPLTPNGKLDTKALPDPGDDSDADRGYEAPQGEVEVALASIWAGLLRIERVGRGDNFFELGGHSLLATQVVSKIRELFSVDLPLKVFFDHGSVAELAVSILSAERSKIPAIQPVVRPHLLPLSFSQERLWFIHQLDPSSPGYNVAGAVRIRREIDADQLEQAFTRVIERHESLRTLFSVHDGQPYQNILAATDFQLQRDDLSGRDVQTREHQARLILQSDALAPFDLEQGPLFRSRIVTLDDDDHILMLNMHHIVSDGWSINLLITELAAILNGMGSSLPSLPVQYADYSVWQRRWLAESGTLKLQLAYWQHKLNGVPEVMGLTTDFPRPILQSSSGAAREFRVSEELLARLKDQAENNGCTLFMVLLAAVKVLMYRYTGQSDVCIGTPIANRQYEETQGLIGMFVNTMALRTTIEQESTFADVLAAVKRTCLEAYDNQDAPFEKIVDILRVRRNMAVSPLFQVMVALENVDADNVADDVENYPLESRISKFDLSIDFIETKSSLTGIIEFSTSIYLESRIDRMVDHLLAMLGAAATEPLTKVNDIDYLGSDRQQLLIGFNDTRAQYPTDKCIHDIFVEQAVLYAHRTAVQIGDRTLSYRELGARSLDIAFELQSLGVGPNDIVGLCVERSFEMVAGLLGILQAGGIFLPLDPECPSDHLAYMLQDSGVRLVITQEKFTALLQVDDSSPTELFVLDNAQPTAVRDVEGPRTDRYKLQRAVMPSDPAYVIYTSGSAGLPNGVLVQHASLVNHSADVRRRCRFDADDIQIQFSSMNLDLFLEEVFSSLNSGAKLVLAPNSDVLTLPVLEALIDDHQASVVNVPTAFFHELADSGVRLRSLKCIVVGGERLDCSRVRAFIDRHPGVMLHNTYGPAEATVFSTATSVTPELLEARDIVPIGRPIANTQIYILDPNRNPQPVGIPGELYIAGDGLARGYLNRPELTRERFVDNPFTPGTRMYRTGDLAQWLDDGNVEYLGHIDAQVNIRGFRIELGEIEALLSHHHQVEEAVVVARGELSNKQLIAFYRLKPDCVEHEAQLMQDHLKAFLQQTLPAHMIPSGFVCMASFPLAPNGNVDRYALEHSDVQPIPGSGFVAARTPTEQQIVSIWAHVLRIPAHKIGINDNFFELGGHSLLATQLVSKMRAQFAVDLPLQVLFDHGSIAELAVSILAAERSTIPAIQPVVRPPFLPLSFSQERLWFIHQLDPSSPGYNMAGAVRIRSAIDADLLEQAFIRIIDRHESLRTLFSVHDGLPYQNVLNDANFHLQREDLSDKDVSTREQKAKLILQSDALAPFDLEHGPLFRSRIVTLDDDDHILMLNMHHIVSDGWSIDLLINELTAILKGMGASLPSLPIQYADYSVWQRQWLTESGTLKRQLAYWQEKLAGVPEMIGLATDYPRPVLQSTAGATHAFHLNEELVARLRDQAEKNGCTLYMVLLAAVKVLMYRYTSQGDICIGAPIANRQYQETQGLIGMFVNTLALRTTIEAENTFADVLAAVKRTCLDAYEHQDAPFDKVVEAVRPRRNMAISPLFQVMVMLQNMDIESTESYFQPYDLGKTASKFDLSVEFTEVAQGLSCEIEYCTALYCAPRIARIAAHLSAVLDAMASMPTTKVVAFDYLRGERSHLLTDLAGTQTSGTPGDPVFMLHQRFESQVAERPDAVAVECDAETLTYAQLNVQANRIAHALLAQGVSPDDRVAISVDRGIAMVAGLLGILKSGAAYVPFDPGYPAARLAYLLEDSAPRVLLTQAKYMHSDLVKQADAQSVNVLMLDEGAFDGQPDDNPDVVVAPEHLAYVIYTSGSTGQPKGVMIEHASLGNYLRWAVETYTQDGRPCDTIVSSPIAFDATVTSVYLPLLTGGRAVLLRTGDELVGLDALLRERRSWGLLKITPLHWRELGQRLAADDVRCKVERFVVGGEALSYSTVQLWQGIAPQGRCINEYGPTETVVGCTIYEVPEGECGHADVSIGRPIANTQIYILDPNRNPQPVGIPGELYIAGDGLARGYLNRPELTRERFVDNPFTPGTRMYRTGDLARWQEDGNIEYLGRIDTQVKIRGFRIELGEIEALLSAHPQIESVVVVARGEQANKQLIAFYLPKDVDHSSEAELPPDELKAYLQQTLPGYMIPSGFMRLETIPLTPSGKVDRGLLESLDVRMASSRGYVAARTPTEQQIVRIWADVLKLDPDTIGVNDDFFELGGHSLLATQIVSKMRAQFAVDLPLRALFDHGNIAELAVSIPSAERSTIPTIQPVVRPPFLPLSFSQERLWFIHQLDPSSPGYNMAGAVRIRSAIDADLLEQAFIRIIDRHESLRTLFSVHDGLPYQNVLNDANFHLQREDLSDKDVSTREQKAKLILQSDALAPFDLEHGPLFRSRIVTLDDDDHILMLNMHHIVSDGWSIDLLINELTAILKGMGASLPSLPIQYADYSVWQRQWLTESGTLKRQLAYWQEKLAGVPEMIGLATDYPRPVLQSTAGATHAFHLNEELVARLRDQAEKNGCTLYMVLLAAVKVLMYRYTSQGDICIGAPIANRQYQETQGLIGMFVNTLALRTTIEAENTFADVLAAVKRTCLDAYEHQDAPFDKVVEAVRPRRNMAISPLFQVMVMLQNMDIESTESYFQPYDLGKTASKFDLSVEFTEVAQGLSCEIEYCTALYCAPRIARIAAHLSAVLDAMASMPTTKVVAFDYLRGERSHLLTDLAGTQTSGTPGDPVFMLHQRFESQVAERPDAVAVECDAETLTYAQLNVQANRIAHALLAQGVSPDDRVAISVDRGIAMVAGLLGILKSGAAYVPFDPGYPAARLAYLLEDSAPRVLLTQAKYMHSDLVKQADAQSVNVLMLDEGAFDGQPDDNPDVVVAPEHLAYVIYTSGSTGQPKGVMIEHASLGNYLRWAVETYTQDGRPCDTIVSSPIAFDATVTSVYLPLLTGGRAVLLRTGDELVGLDALLRERRSWGLLKITPLHWRELGQRLAADDVRCKVERFVVGGEALSYSTVQLWQGIAPQGRCINEYGPTETVVGCTIYEVPEGECGHADVSIGRPIANTQIYILDPNRNPQPVGIPGELYIAGDGLARGYLNRPELTRERFVDNPFTPGTRMYRTGDLARWQEDGNIEYLGRIDTQVKIRGFRIELGEIEALLSAHPQIESVVVVARGEQANKQLIAFYLPKDVDHSSEAELPPEALKAYLQQTLPGYMIPSGFVRLDTIPLTPSGKVDRGLLESLDVRMASSRGYVGARTPTEQQIVGIWADVLKLDPDTIGVNDDFFELGGHSLLAVSIMAKTKDCFGRLLPLAALFSAPTVADFAQLIADDEDRFSDIAVQIQAGGERPPIFAVPGAGGSVLSFRALSEALGSDQPFFGLQAVGLDGGMQPLETVEATAAANVAAIRAIQPRGPYRLIGHSYGGVVAFEMARLLLEQGDDVAELALLDAVAPHTMQTRKSTDDSEDIGELCVALAELGGVRLKISADELRGLTLDELADVLAENELEIGKEQLEILYGVFKTNLRCYERYRPARLQWDISARLYRAADRSAQDEDWRHDYGWSDILQQPPLIFDLDASHFSMLHDPAVRVLAAELRRTAVVS